jgi:hypothetical protein
LLGAELAGEEAIPLRLAVEPVPFGVASVMRRPPVTCHSIRFLQIWCG